MKVQSIRGMNDIAPPEVYSWLDIENTCREVFEAFGYSELRTPVVEMTALFKRGVGEDTDIVEKEMYTFEDRSGDSLSLRPEGTASVVRALNQHGWINENPVSKFYYIGPMFRHERPQKGRYRQFYQLGAELFGVAEASADVDMLALGHVFFSKLGIGAELRLSSIGCGVCRPPYKKMLIEKLEPQKDKLPKDFHSRIPTNPQRIFDHKDEEAQKVAATLPVLLDHLCEECKEHFAKVKEGLDRLEIPYVVDPKIVRGLDYYNRTAFEYVSGGLGSQSAVGGGGRYDNLVENLGGKPVPAVGFALGLERIAMLLEQKQKPAYPPVDVFFVSPDPTGFGKCTELCHALRVEGFRSELDLQGRSMKAQMKKANKLSSRFCVILGGQEIDKGIGILRDMQTQSQEEIALDSLKDQLLVRLKK